jgi:hypothetical protein
MKQMRLYGMVVGVLIVAGLAGWQTGLFSQAPTEMHVYKTPYCGCCAKWVEHMEQNGFKVTVENRDNLKDIKQQHGVRPALESCHTGLIDGYVVEGHVPADVVQQFLEEKPEGAIGLTVPGMPIGSPGMEQGNRYDRYDVLTFDKEGNTTVFAKR